MHPARRGQRPPPVKLSRPAWGPHDERGRASPGRRIAVRRAYGRRLVSGEGGWCTRTGGGAAAARPMRYGGLREEGRRPGFAGEDQSCRGRGRQDDRAEQAAAEQAAIGEMAGAAGVATGRRGVGAMGGADHVAEGVERGRIGPSAHGQGAGERLENEETGRDERDPGPLPPPPSLQRTPPCDPILPSIPPPTCLPGQAAARRVPLPPGFACAAQAVRSRPATAKSPGIRNKVSRETFFEVSRGLMFPVRSQRPSAKCLKSLVSGAGIEPATS